jgi:aminoglycoside/choline kinase family phosphotransferase
VVDMDNMDIENFFKDEIKDFANYKLLAGDASNRRFYRIMLKDNTSIIAMVYPEGFKQKLEDIDFYYSYKYLRSMKFSVPEICKIYQKQGIVLMEDFGDASLETLFYHLDEEVIIKYYKVAVAQLVNLYYCKENKWLKKVQRIGHGYDKLMWELKFFHKYYVQELNKNKLKKEEKIFKIYEDIVNKVCRYPLMIIHRDYHSRNIFFKGGKEIYVCDFQDLRYGPFFYDIASLLYDSYTDLDDELIKELFYYYLDLVNLGNPDAFEQLRYVALHRNLKAIGTFAYLAITQNKKQYLQYIPNTVKHIKSHLRILSQYKLLQRILL